MCHALAPGQPHFQRQISPPPPLAYGSCGQRGRAPRSGLDGMAPSHARLHRWRPGVSLARGVDRAWDPTSNAVQALRLHLLAALAGV